MTFLEAWEKSRGIKESVDNAAIDAIFSGLNVSKDFWDNFILVCNNKDGMSALLNVSPEKIVSWPLAIQNNLEKSKEHRSPEEKEKTKIMNTGNSEENNENI